MTGKIYKNWKILNRAEKPAHIKSQANSIWWLCECIECGAKKVINGTEIRRNKTGACRCSKKKNIKPKEKRTRLRSGSSVKDEIGNIYGKLTVLEFAYTKNSKAYWKCRCECGKETISSGNALRNGRIHSCGCLSSYKEYEISQLLLKNNIKFEQQFKFNDLIDKSYLRFDFAIFNTKNELVGLIEYNGDQHYNPSDPFYKESVAKHDTMKIDYCQHHQIPLLILNKNNYQTLFILQWINSLIK